MTTSGKFHSKAKEAIITGQHSIAECNHQLHGKYIHHIPNKATDDKPKVKVYNSDGTKEYIIPSRNPVDVPAILPSTEFNRLKKQAHHLELPHLGIMQREVYGGFMQQKLKLTANKRDLRKRLLVVTLKDRMELIEEAQRQRNELQDESNKRKELLLKSQKTQKAVPGSKLDSVESEAANKNLYLLRRSQELLIEQDDRVKAANGVILATKCRVIRNAQIAEKRLIEKQLQEEDRRLDNMMEQQRQKLIGIEEHKREVNKKKIHRYETEVKQQIKANELQRLMEAQKIEEESRMLNKALIQLQKDEEQKDREKKEKQLKMREEFKKANAEAENYRLLKEEEQRIAELRIQQFMKEKQAREEAREREIELANAEKEKEIAKLRAQQEKSQDHQAAMDEMNALRTQEEKEREWREAEKAAAIRHKEQLEDLRRSRAQQIEDIRKQQAVALARDEEDFLKVAKVQRHLFEKDMEERRKKKENNVKHKKELLQQINEKEKERILWIQEKFEDGNAQRLEVDINDRKVANYLKEKVDKLRDNNVPEMYIKDIERILKIKK